MNKPPKLVFLSIDSLNSEVLSEYLPRLKHAHPFGFKKILTQSNQNAELVIHDPTITASSHNSTITCSSAGTHGIFANSQWDGSRPVSGFSEPTQTETFATVLTSAGLKVVTAGYPALDNSEVGRKVSEGFSYGEILGQSALIGASTDAPLEHSWKNSKNETIATVKIVKISEGRRKAECVSPNCSITVSEDQTRQDIQILMGFDRASAYAFSVDSPEKYFYISQLAINKAFPEQNSRKLNECGIIFSPGKDVSLSRFGTKPVISGLEHRLSFFKKAWTTYLPNSNADALFLYLEDLDALRHQYSGDLAAQIDVIAHLEKVDQLLGEFIQSLPAATNVVVMGDHGMATIQRELNIRQILPRNALNEGLIFTSGGTLLIYGKKTQANGKLRNVPTNDDLEWLESSKNQLLRFRLPGQSGQIFEKVFLKNSSEMQRAGLSHPNAPFLIAFANDSIALQDSVSDKLILADLQNMDLPAPRPRGQHGHNSQNKSMRAFLTLWGPDLDSLAAKSIKTNIDVVPAIAHALHWPVPKQCNHQDK